MNKKILFIVFIVFIVFLIGCQKYTQEECINDCTKSYLWDSYEEYQSYEIRQAYCNDLCYDILNGVDEK